MIERKYKKQQIIELQLSYDKKEWKPHGNTTISLKKRK